MTKTVCFSLQIPQFRGPQALGPVPTAIGVSIAIDKISAAVLSMEEPVSSGFAFQFALSCLSLCSHLHGALDVAAIH